MIKSSIILFLTCFFLYLPFSREPDYFDSETAPATIVSRGDSVVALYNEFGKPYALKLDKQSYQTQFLQKIILIKNHLTINIDLILDEF